MNIANVTKHLMLPVFGARPSDVLVHRATVHRLLKTHLTLVQCLVLLRPTFDECFLVRNTLVTSLNPTEGVSTLLYLSNFISFANVSTLHQVYTTICMCVSNFTNIFSKELATQLATPLDSNTYA